MTSLYDYAGYVLDLATQNVEKDGGPFAAIIIKEGRLIAEGVNRVSLINDPTAHAEVEAIRAACTILNTYQLTGCILITSCEPCPMCLGAIYWSRLDAVYYVAGKEDASEAGFDDGFIYRELEMPGADRAIPFIVMQSQDKNRPFKAWVAKEDRREY